MVDVSLSPCVSTRSWSWPAELGGARFSFGTVSALGTDSDGRISCHGRRLNIRLRLRRGEVLVNPTGKGTFSQD